MNQLIEKGKISSSQFKFAIMCFLVGAALITGFYAKETKQDSWMVILSGYIVFLIFLWFYLLLVKNFPGKNLIQIHDLIYGPFLGKIISALYIFYFFTVESFNLRDLGNFVSGSLLPETPIVIVLALTTIICAWTIHKGVEVVVRYGMIFFCLWIILTFMTIILSYDNLKFDNLLPMFSQPLMNYIHGTHISATICFGEIIIFLMIVPSVNDQSKINRSFFQGLTFGMIALLFIVIIDTIVLGKYTPILTLASYETLRMIDVAGIFSRMEIIFVAIHLILQFFKISVFYYVMVLSIAQVCNLRSYKSIINISGIILISYSIVIASSNIESAAFGNDAATFFSGFFELLLPVITFLIFKIKKKINKSTKDNI